MEGEGDKLQIGAADIPYRRRNRRAEGGIPEEHGVAVQHNFQKVFDQILALATQAKLAEKMIKRVFVFRDMEFDQASSNPWETDYEVIKRKFRESGYSGPPEMVFWNLRTSSSTQVTKEEKGVALVSGFSKNQLKLFLDEGRALTPAEVMQAAITCDEYAGLVIFH